MPKYFFDKSTIWEERFVTLPPDITRHLKVAKEFNSIILCDGEGVDYHAQRTRSYQKFAVQQGQKGRKAKPRMTTWNPENPKEETSIFMISNPTPCTTELEFPITLYQALPKGDKLDLIIQKCVELGVDEIVPVCTAHSIARIKDSNKKSERYQRISLSAAEQSMRGKIPTVRPAISFEDAVQNIAEDTLHVVAYENENQRTMKEILTENKPQSIGIWIGAEGGFAENEIAELTKRGAVTASLGRRILRTETAAIAAIAQITCMWEG